MRSTPSQPLSSYVHQTKDRLTNKFPISYCSALLTRLPAILSDQRRLESIFPCVCRCVCAQAGWRVNSRASICPRLNFVEFRQFFIRRRSANFTPWSCRLRCAWPEWPMTTTANTLVTNSSRRLSTAAFLFPFPDFFFRRSLHLWQSAFHVAHFSGGEMRLVHDSWRKENIPKPTKTWRHQPSGGKVWDKLSSSTWTRARFLVFLCKKSLFWFLIQTLDGHVPL